MTTTSTTTWTSLHNEHVWYFKYSLMQIVLHFYLFKILMQRLFQQICEYIFLP